MQPSKHKLKGFLVYEEIYRRHGQTMNNKDIVIPWDKGKLIVSENGRFLAHENGEPFFWLGDTGWLMFSRLNREEAEVYLEDRRVKGFNLIQVMIIHTIDAVNVYGKSALVDRDLEIPNVLEDEGCGYWEHMDYIIGLAEKKGLYMALVPVWGTVVETGWATVEKAKSYGEFLANRFKNRPNIVWLNGGDTRGNFNNDIWTALGESIKNIDKHHLMTFHPFGRTTSSTWFHNEKWLDFNMFQSGHRRYDQVIKKDKEVMENLWIGQDNWRYVQNDYEKTPIKPTIDGEPSYEGIPQGLHDFTEPCWTDDDCRRYAYWAVFAGAFGYTFGNNSVMQMHEPGKGIGDFGATTYWFDAINDVGAGQMQYLKNLMLSVSYFDRVPDQSVIHGDEGEKHNRLLATRGRDYIFVYNYTGTKFSINMGRISGDSVNVWWFNPRNGEKLYLGNYINSGVREFLPPGKTMDGNDWVLIIADENISFYS
jgi:hypothetical protein